MDDPNDIAKTYIIRPFGTFSQLSEIVSLTSMPLPERPDGVVLVAKYSSTSLPNCVATERQYEDLARANPDALFLRSYEEYEGFEALAGNQGVAVLPTYDFYFKGNRVARVEGNREGECVLRRRY
jgi:hypothetical protein